MGGSNQDALEAAATAPEPLLTSPPSRSGRPEPRGAVERQLELHHRDGALVTGSSTPDELEVHCKLHNQLVARDVFGRAHVERRIRESRASRRATE